MGDHYSHLSYNDRLTIHRMDRKGFKPDEIAAAVGCCRATVYNELKRARYTHINSEFIEEDRYNPDEAQRRYEELLSQKGRPLQFADDTELLDYLEMKIRDHKYSPEAVLLEIKEKDLPFKNQIRSVNTVYKYIRRGIFDGLTMEHLPVKKKKKKASVKRQKRASKGRSIEKRPAEVENREVFGHWEMDTVIGQVDNRKSLLVLTERKTRQELTEVLKSHTTNEVRKALNRVEKKMGSAFYHIFKTITVDNGVEFSDTDGMEKALYRVGKRTEIYYCHAYRSCERGSNEVQNKLIRRWYPKGSDFDEILNKRDVKEMEEWINNYPRKMFGGRCSNDLFKEECAALGVFP